MSWTSRTAEAGVLAVAALAVISAAARPPAAVSAKAQPPLERLTVASDGHPMAVWARRPATPRGSVLLVHGRTWSSRPDFDLQVPGLQRSVMVSLAAAGFAVYAVDLRGYGETPRDESGWLTPRRSAADVSNVLGWIAAQHSALPKPALIGWSRGAAVGMLVAQTAPRQLSAIVLFGFVFDPASPYVDSPAPARPPRLKNTAESAASDFVSPGVTPNVVVETFVREALQRDPVTADLRSDTEFNVLDPARITVPTLLLYGEHDINVPRADGARFFARLATRDKQIVELKGADHVAQLEDTHDAWVGAVVGFLSRPRR